jgi:hypothetical protein
MARRSPYGDVERRFQAHRTGAESPLVDTVRVIDIRLLRLTDRQRSSR